MAIDAEPQTWFHAIINVGNTTGDLALNPGDFLGIRGANGCGKTTLLKHLAGLGSVGLDLAITRYWQGRVVDDPDQEFQASLHWLGHRQGLNEGLTVGEEWAFWQHLFPHTVSIDVGAIAARLGITEIINSPIVRLSAGERQKAALGRLLLIPRRLWLLDEPDSHLDQPSRETLYQLISEHCAQGGMAMVASHQPELSRFATTLYEMR